MAELDQLAERGRYDFGVWIGASVVFVVAGLLWVAGDRLSRRPDFDQAPNVPTTLVTTTDAVGATRRCGNLSDWLDCRHTDGTMRARLQAVGALEDGCVNLGDMADATAAQLGGRGHDADLLPLTNCDKATQTIYSTAIAELGPADLNTLLTALLPSTQ